MRMWPQLSRLNATYASLDSSASPQSGWLVVPRYWVWMCGGSRGGCFGDVATLSPMFRGWEAIGIWIATSQVCKKKLCINTGSRGQLRGERVSDATCETLMYTTAQNVSQVVRETRKPRNLPGDPVFIHNFVFVINLIGAYSYRYIGL